MNDASSSQLHHVDQHDICSLPKRKIQKRKRRLVLGSYDDIVEQPAAEVASETTVGEPTVEVAGETVVEESSIANVLEEQQEDTVVENIAEPVSEPAVTDVANAGMSTAVTPMPMEVTGSKKMK
ncbi:hypothetical protein F511_37152 [Dorcoceras hygrometricum]|uniref:Uncharacterized protein n=1 Tax=Dorcoceras hygrometricum TaxID=472368 RepID=A0A2Z7BW06_9LAMI|nr:hypothetical protein F511_37152 [Dorcoceras hygrometricum]